MKRVDVLLMEGLISNPGSVTGLVYGISPSDGSTWSGVNPGGAEVLKDDTSRLGDGTSTMGYEMLYDISGGVPGDRVEIELLRSGVRSIAGDSTWY